MGALPGAIVGAIAGATSGYFMGEAYTKNNDAYREAAEELSKAVLQGEVSTNQKEMTEFLKA
jgi:hypothetical protein